MLVNYFMKKKILPLILFATSSNVYGYNLEGACSLEAFAGTALFYTPEIFNFNQSDQYIQQKGEFNFKLPNLYASVSLALRDNLELGLEAGGINLLGVFINNFEFDYKYNIADKTILINSLVAKDNIDSLKNGTTDEKYIYSFFTKPLNDVKAKQNIKSKYIATKLNCPFEIFDGLNINFGGLIGLAKPEYKDTFKDSKDELSSTKSITVEYSSKDEVSLLKGFHGGVKCEYSDILSFGFNISWKHYSPITSKTTATVDTSITNRSPTQTIKELKNQSGADKIGFNHFAWAISGTLNF